eukprot:TRINITY_DN31985_c0_g1_i1.p1 TRINITY_DN31985_c0_g1~~TRINITY_DN31985_c0_g1_i1.p1  ORF type:complete len:388 (-),score=85.20 TRINITY_DN31985_c0_g1_i1:69-1232(-)
MAEAGGGEEDTPAAKCAVYAAAVVAGCVKDGDDATTDEFLEYSALQRHRDEFLEAEGTPLRTAVLSGRGCALVATARIDDAGACLLAEAPVVLVQTRASRAEVLACAACLVPLSGLACHVDVVECACGEKYCSEACRSTAAADWHCALCPASLPTAAAEARCKLLGLIEELPAVGEAFEAAARLLARCTTPEPSEAQIRRQLWTRLQGLAGAPWWRTVRLARAELEAEAIETTARALRYLQAILPAESPAHELSVESFATLVGQVRMNAVEALVPAPSDEDASTTSDAEAAVAAANPGLGSSVSSGIALHLVLSAVNHDCSPNCTLETGIPMPEIRGWAVLQARRPIEAGEEVTIAYAPAEEGRRRQLAEQWLFSCGCETCSAQASG